MAHFSLVVIGSGSGNVVVPKDPAQGPVALIESGVFGGTCLNRGCIPSKILIHTADVAEQVRRAAEFGIEANLTGVDWPAIRDRTFDKTDGVSAKGRRYRAESDGVTLIEGRARFTGPRELAVDDGTRITADRIVLATGARPVIPPAIAESGGDYHTSETVMRLDRLPASMVIVGGGYIAAEFAHLFSGLGVNVSIVNRGRSLLERFDPEVSGRFTKLASKRWDVHLSAAVTGARQRGGQVVCGSITQLPYADHLFDLVCALDIVEHVDDDAAALEELSRVARPGAVVLLSVPLHPELWNAFDDFVGHRRRYRPELLPEMLGRHGLTIERSAVYGMQPRSSRLLDLGMWFLTNQRKRALWWYNRVFMPMGLRLQKKLEFGAGLIAARDVDEILMICRKSARMSVSEY